MGSAGVNTGNDDFNKAAWLADAEGHLLQYKAHLAQFDNITSLYLTKLGPEGKKLMVEVRAMTEALHQAIDAIRKGLAGDDPFA